MMNPDSTTKKFPWKDLVFIIVGILCIVAWWFYRPQITSFWHSSMAKISAMSLPSFGGQTNDNATLPDNKVAQNLTQEKDCGISTSPDLKNPYSYQNDKVLNCMGASALSCQNAKAVLSDPLFPTIFQIVKNQNTCNFKLSYDKNSTLSDITGHKLAGQDISCPVSIVKALDESNSQSPEFNVPNKENLSKYASQIYFYGTLGVFIENNLDKNKIQGMGCTGTYIDSVISSYKAQSKA